MTKNIHPCPILSRWLLVTLLIFLVPLGCSKIKPMNGDPSFESTEREIKEQGFARISVKHLNNSEQGLMPFSGLA